MIDELRAALTGRYAHQNEAELQESIGELLDAAGVDFQREVHIAPHSRIDFLVGDVGLEVKIDSSLAALTRQVTRYAESGRLSRVVVVTDKLRLTALPGEIAGVPIETIHLGAL